MEGTDESTELWQHHSLVLCNCSRRYKERVAPKREWCDILRLCQRARERERSLLQKTLLFTFSKYQRQAFEPSTDLRPYLSTAPFRGQCDQMVRLCFQHLAIYNQKIAR